MAWTTPPTLTDGQVLTGAHTQIWRDDLNLTAPALATTTGQFFVATGTNTVAARLPQAAFVATSEATASTSYAALTTPGPAVTVTCGSFVLVGISCKMTQNTNAVLALASFAITGASSAVASDLVAIQRQFAAAATDTMRCSSVMIQTGMTPGSNTFTMQYRVGGGSTGYDSRNIFVVPF